MSWTDSLNSITNAASDIYTANRTASAAEKNAKAANANATATIMSSRNMMIAGIVVALAVVAFVFLRKR